MVGKYCEMEVDSVKEGFFVRTGVALPVAAGICNCTIAHCAHVLCTIVHSRLIVQFDQCPVVQHFQKLFYRLCFFAYCLYFSRGSYLLSPLISMRKHYIFKVNCHFVVCSSHSLLRIFPTVTSWLGN